MCLDAMELQSTKQSRSILYSIAPVQASATALMPDHVTWPSVQLLSCTGQQALQPCSRHATSSLRILPLNVIKGDVHAAAEQISWQVSGAVVKLAEGRGRGEPRVLEVWGAPDQVQAAQNLVQAFLLVGHQQPGPYER